METAPKPEGTEFKRFYHWYWEWDDAKRLDFSLKLRARARRLVGSVNADDLAQEVIAALLKSSTPYADISLIGLAARKARELAKAYRRQPVQAEFTDALPDPGDDPFEAMLKREVDEEAQEAYKAWVRQIYTAATPAHRKLLDAFIEMCSDPNIGQFKCENGVYSGEVSSLSVLITPTDLDGIDYIATVADTEAEVGRAWNRTDEESGTSYISLKLDSPFLPAPTYCSLLQQPDGSYNLVWHRPDSLADAPYREGDKRPQFNNTNIATHLGIPVEQVERMGDAIRRWLLRRPDTTEPIKARLKGRRRTSTSPIAGSRLTKAEGAEYPGPCRRSSE